MCVHYDEASEKSKLIRSCKVNKNSFGTNEREAKFELNGSLASTRHFLKSYFKPTL